MLHTRAVKSRLRPCMLSKNVPAFALRSVHWQGKSERVAKTEGQKHIQKIMEGSRRRNPSERGPAEMCKSVNQTRALVTMAGVANTARTHELATTIVCVGSLVESES